VERNPVKANLVASARNWEWSSAHPARQVLLSEWPIPKPSDWLDIVDRPQTEAELIAIRRRLRRGAPLGDEEWTLRTAEALGLTSTLRSPGRPRGSNKPRSTGG